VAAASLLSDSIVPQCENSLKSECIDFLAFDRWEEMFHDTNLTGALVDRVTYKAHILDMSGESHRLKETLSMMGK
jgi:DNA replication protein DnaC